MLHVELVYATQMLLQKQERETKVAVHNLKRRKINASKKIKQALRGCQAPDLTH